MIANLPLLLVNGNPAALSTVSADQLEKFITFMVTCSWGHDTAKDIQQPPWWPHDVPFSHPFIKPAILPEDWEKRLRNLVGLCYNYHRSSFLLVYSAQLARYPPRKLRYVYNRDNTTSLYYRPNRQLLVTFRNENILYDKTELVHEATMSLKTADIYLCDNCDSHFDNKDTLEAHERLCNNDNIPSITHSGSLAELLLALKLQPSKDIQAPRAQSNNEDIKPKNTRNVNIHKETQCPFSSIAYKKRAKINVQRDFNFSRERIERYCCTSAPINKISKNKTFQFPVRYKIPNEKEHWDRTYTFPNQRKKIILDLKGQLLYLKCRPVSVKVEQMTQKKIDGYINTLQEKSRKKVSERDKEDIIYVDGLDSDQAMEVDTSSDPLKKLDNDCEVIDLCSDDEGPHGNENFDPRAGITCVMRGGAVLRRTAATPHALPAEPCGARQNTFATINLPAAIMRPHPVVLITHTANSLKTIPIDSIKFDLKK